MLPKYASREWFEYMFEQGDRWGHDWRASQSFRYTLYLNILKHILTRNSGMKILDIGCGICNFTYKLYTINRENDFYGIDISRNSINLASKKYPFFILQRAELPDIPFKGVSFDVILCLEVLYYLKKDQREESLNNIRKFLNPSGILLFSTVLGPNYMEENEAIELISKYFMIEKIIYNYGRLYRLFEKPLLKIMKLNDLFKTVLLKNKKFNINILKKSFLAVKLIEVINKNSKLNAWTISFLNILNLSLKKLLSNVFITRICYKLSKFLLRGYGKTQIVILAKKPDGE